MNDTIEKPTESSPLNIRNPRAELHTAGISIQQKPTIESRDEFDSMIVAPSGTLGKGYAEDLAFGEDPVTIRIERSSEKNAAPMIDCWVNGKGAEVLAVNGKWIELGYLLVGVPLTTKRKYVEVLARAKHDTVNTKVTKLAESELNEIERYSSSRAPFSVIKDANPRGAEWLTNLVRYL